MAQQNDPTGLADARQGFSAASATKLNIMFDLASTGVVCEGGPHIV
jgi:hypothetical protein